jgi:hypothetical protein
MSAAGSKRNKPAKSKYTNSGTWKQGSKLSSKAKMDEMKAIYRDYHNSHNYDDRSSTYYHSERKNSSCYKSEHSEDKHNYSAFVSRKQSPLDKYSSESDDKRTSDSLTIPHAGLHLHAARTVQNSDGNASHRDKTVMRKEQSISHVPPPSASGATHPYNQTQIQTQIQNYTQNQKDIQNNSVNESKVLQTISNFTPNQPSFHNQNHVGSNHNLNSSNNGKIVNSGSISGKHGIQLLRQAKIPNPPPPECWKPAAEKVFIRKKNLNIEAILNYAK